MDGNVEGGSISQTDPTIGDPNFDLQNELFAGKMGSYFRWKTIRTAGPALPRGNRGSSVHPFRPATSSFSSHYTVAAAPPYYGEFYNRRPSSALAGPAGSGVCFTQRGVLLVAHRRPCTPRSGT
ncbi:hypothetical protein HPP92_027192 [Vanilla planifolia]|uniref:Uncharacterized protein n=1 Tax=Vanilla planifolia TaxID=51239 RepID=A0A835PC96_VANPL|nr:hypothetical protein HPP92_027192 [Vanilla planifolia]